MASRYFPINKIFLSALLLSSVSFSFAGCLSSEGAASCSGASCGGVDTDGSAGDALVDTITSFSDAGDAPSDVAQDVYVPPPTQSLGCSSGSGASTPAGGVSVTMANGRKYQILVPSTYSPGSAIPVLFMFHGIGVTGTAFQSWFKMEDYVKNDAIVVYPDAQSGSWDVSGTKDLQFVDAMIAEIGKNYCINPSRTFGFGFSWGAYFTHHLGCKRAGTIKAISGNEGGAASLSSCGNLPVLVTHRTEDNDEAVAKGRAAAALWSTLNQCQSTQTVSNAAFNCKSYNNCLPGNPVIYCEDTSLNDPSWPADWKHTVKENYRQFIWDWMKTLP